MPGEVLEVLLEAFTNAVSATKQTEDGMYVNPLMSGRAYLRVLEDEDVLKIVYGGWATKTVTRHKPSFTPPRPQKVPEDPYNRSII